MLEFCQNTALRRFINWGQCLPSAFSTIADRYAFSAWTAPGIAPANPTTAGISADYKASTEGDRYNAHSSGLSW
jgi:hypothetical protein